MILSRLDFHKFDFLHINIKILNLSFNNIEKIDFLNKSINLEFLNISYNQIKELQGLENC